MTTRDIGLVALFAAVIVALGAVPAFPLAVLPVPITLQSLGVMLAGLVLGPKRGAAAPLVVIALVAIGLPVLAGGRGGLVVFAGPTAGFLIGWVPAAFVAGLLAMRLDRDGTPALVRALSAVRLNALTRPLARGGTGTVSRLLGLIAAALIGGVVVDYAFGIVWLAFAAKIGLAKAFYGSLAFIPGDIVKAVIAALVTLKVGDAYRLDRR
ncbi:biotin transporter BioY [Siculibacillus lacustris]|uniref:Biotin transporter n=1 Tax=Siculibacillus lacustris TaxID=1549641 RepID=A0A4Q9VGM7_9HYPH|nr:biotin transporter BioY [Siculibacillus lacustris]TBW34071.1 biotin transporter BioY [Siculibacillus lacustris]